MSSFQLLSRSIQKKIWDMKWSSFTPIQESTIPVLINSTKDIVISSATASGKTEAAFLPILSNIETSGQGALKVMYISPLKALINNQFERIEQLLEGMYIPLHKWHGDVSGSKKKSFVKKPSGILQITPESIESLFINRTEALAHIFKDLEYIIIDEVHSFVSADRGVQLRSLLSRIEAYTNQRPRIIGLSATIDNFQLVKEWVRYEDPDNVEVIEAKGSERKLNYHLMHLPVDEESKEPLGLYEDIRYELTREAKAIIFCNSRAGVEQTTVSLNRLAKREGAGEVYYTHHSSIDKSEREYVEKLMQDTKTPKSIVSTSTLELGIDIGSVDIIIQIDSTFSVSSLKQRLGRSGRKQGSAQTLQLYSTSASQMLQAMAVMELVLEKWIEPATRYPVPYDILFQQLLSMCKTANGKPKTELLDAIEGNHIFHELDREKINQLIENMVVNDYLEKVSGRGELIVGWEGEKIVNSREFYVVFKTSDTYSVIHGARTIGTFDKAHLVTIGDNVILAGKLWTILDVDKEKSKVYVGKAVNGKPPRYHSGEANTHPRIGEKMFDLLISDQAIPYADEHAQATLQSMRRPYQLNHIAAGERIIWQAPMKLIIETYTGSKVARAITMALRYLSYQASLPNGLGVIEVIGMNNNTVHLLQQLKEKNWTAPLLFTQLAEHERMETRYSPYLPRNLREEIQVESQLDVEGMKDYLEKITFRVIPS
ncbi:DEAD/DEAH box helicase [Bacillaceae bacterium JMAK1]|nr:DEAD/DEAH box helicase [Bacillaceae bacterium JMAK1]